MTASDVRAPARTTPARRLAAAAIVAAGACFVLGVYALTIDDKNACGRDYIQYWAAEQQLAHHANPYDIDAIYRLEKSRGLEEDSPKVTFSPPVAFEFALPLGYMGAKAGLLLWLASLLACAGLAMWVLWMVHGRPDSRLHVFVFGFPPVLACLMAGQLGIFFLLGIALFLWLHQTRPWLAGAAMLGCALKPHLFLPCAVVLVLWSVKRRSFAVIGGFVVALATSCALTLLMDPEAWRQYFEMMRSTRVLDVFIPTLAVALRFAVNPAAHWIEFVPEALACAWAVWYYATRRNRWQWGREGLLVLLVGAVCTPYSFFTDQAVLFPAILAGMYAAGKDVIAWVLLALVVAGGLVGVVAAIDLPSPFYLWTAPAWLAWYLYAVRGKSQSASAAISAN
ncbi:MAG TPA: glycosyltransferase family 87 protein [Terracidiphilus sp.]|nr:glycosyltransferase family 87 protein [Terracidiphilus sp.]